MGIPKVTKASTAQECQFSSHDERKTRFVVYLSSPLSQSLEMRTDENLLEQSPVDLHQPTQIFAVTGEGVCHQSPDIVHQIHPTVRLAHIDS